MIRPDILHNSPGHLGRGSDKITARSLKMLQRDRPMDKLTSKWKDERTDIFMDFVSINQYSEVWSCVFKTENERNKVIRPKSRASAHLKKKMFKKKNL